MGHSGPETGQGAIAAGKVDRLDVPGQSCDTREIWGRAARHVEIMAARGLRTNTQKDVARTIELMTHDVEAEWFTRLIGYVLANTEGAGGTIKNPVGFIKSELQKYDRSPADATLYDVPAPKQPAVKRPVALENGAHKSTRWLEWERDRVGPMPLDALEWYYANGQMSDEEYYRRGAEWNAWCDARRATKTPIAQSAPVAQTPEVITHAAPVDPDMMERHRAELARWQRDRSRFVTEYTRELGGIAAARAAFERKCPEPQLGGAVTPAPVEPVLATVPAPVVATPIDEPAPAVGSAMVRVMPISGPASVRIIGKLVDGVRVF